MVAGPCPPKRYFGTSLPLAWVASGQRAGFVIADRRGPSVHFSAGIGLCRAAGCICTNLFGQPLRLADDGIVVAADQTTHQLLLAGIAEQLVADQDCTHAVDEPPLISGT